MVNPPGDPDPGVTLLQLRDLERRSVYVSPLHVVAVTSNPRSGRAIVSLSTGEKLEVDHDPREVVDGLAGRRPAPSRTFSRPPGEEARLANERPRRRSGIR